MNDNLTFSALRQANAARQAEWCPDQVPDLSYRGNEMAGEVGEACNVIKKLERERHGWRGSRATVADLAKELADVVITADLAAMQVGIDLGAAVAAKFDEASEKNGLATRMSTSASNRTVDDLAMLVRLLVRYVPETAVIKAGALDYLQRHGLQGSPLRSLECVKPFDPATSPGMTDLMVPPETLDAFMAANPLPPEGVNAVEMSKSAMDVLAERHRQVEVEGWTTEHDDAHNNGEMAGAAAAYAAYRSHTSPETTMGYDLVEMIWPWSSKWWKPKDRRSDLVRAGALILAEIERLDRADTSTEGGQ